MFSDTIISHNTHYFWKSDQLEVRLCAGKSYCPDTVTAFQTYLYLTADHLKTQTDDILYSFVLTSRYSQLPIAIFQCIETPGNVWDSPPCAPFGGVQCEISCLESELVFFLNCIREWVKFHSGKKLVIKTAPSCYEPILHNLIHNCYLNTGFAPIQASINSFISVGQADFNAQIKPAEKRRLKKAATAGLKAGLDSAISSVYVYEFLEKCRSEKGYRMSLTLSQIEELREKFPESYKVFTVMDGLRIVALTLTVRVSDGILYNFLSGNLQHYRVYSPVVMLMESVYQYCQQQNIETLDLGISLDQNGFHKPSLSRFKTNIGGQDGVKVIYETDFRD